jgi:hypothetical protein
MRMMAMTEGGPEQVGISTLLQHDLAMRIQAMHTEYILGQVNSYGSSIHDGLSSSFD